MKSIRFSVISFLFSLYIGLPVSGQTPQFDLDLEWPQVPMGDNWLTGGIGGMCIDSRDHVFLLNRQNVVEADLDGAKLAPPIIELDANGAVVKGWGDPELIGPRLHDCHVETDGSIWIVAAGTGYIQKYSNDGGETRDRPQRDVLRGGDGTTDHTSAMVRRHERTTGPAAASPSPLNIPRGTIRWSGRMSEGRGRRTRAEHGDDGARRKMAKMDLVVKNYFRPNVHPCMLSLRYLCAQGVV